MNNLLVKIFGFSATLVHGDCLVVDRWRWLKTKLKQVKSGKIIDIGCGSGAFTIGSAKLGFDALGLSWDERNRQVATERAKIIKVEDKAKFEILDVRHLDTRDDLLGKYDVAICTENIEHILNDMKLAADIYDVLMPGGVLLLTTPNYNYIPMGIGDSKTNISTIEDGRHVRIGYTEDDLFKLCKSTGFEVISIEYCSGFFSQKLTALSRILIKGTSLKLAWIVMLPFRLLPLLLDKLISKLFSWPGYSICLVAKKNV